MNKLEDYMKRHNPYTTSEGVAIFYDRHIFHEGCCAGSWYHPLLNNHGGRASNKQEEIAFIWRIRPAVEEYLIPFLVEEGVLNKEMMDAYTHTYSYGDRHYRGIVLEDGEYTGRQMAMLYQLLRMSYEFTPSMEAIDVFKTFLDSEKVAEDPVVRKAMVHLSVCAQGHSPYLYEGTNKPINLLGLFYDGNYLFEDFGESKDVLSHFTGRPREVKIPPGWRTTPPHIRDWFENQVGEDHVWCTATYSPQHMSYLSTGRGASVVTSNYRKHLDYILANQKVGVEAAAKVKDKYARPKTPTSPS